jgi:hypothetical protein
MLYEDQPVDPSRFNASASERFTEWLSEHWLALVIGTLCSGTLIVWALLLVARVSYGDENHWAPTSLGSAVASSRVKASAVVFVLLAVVLLVGSTAVEVLT